MAKEFYLLNFLPAIILIILLALFSLDKLALITVFLVPLSFTFKDETSLGVAVSLPTEPILFGIMLLFIIRLFYDLKLDRNLLRHPITIAILVNLGWIIITCLTSTMPVVSFKFLAARLWFIITFYFIASHVFENYSNVKKYIWLYIIPFTIIILYTVINHAAAGFDEQTAHTAMNPFYNDHTSYGAVLAMYIPVLIFFGINSAYSRSIRLAAWIFLLIFIGALILSYTRAAWVSLAITLGVYLLVKARVRMYVLIIATVAGAVWLRANWEQILIKLEKNRKASATEISQHIESITNITTDASNMERINRWQSALRMFREKPVLGWGPGTYQFNYAPFQLSYEKTYISTNLGNKGNAHSEYIGPMAESGLPGMLTFVAILVIVTYRATRLYYRLEKGEPKGLVLALLLGLFTYFIHGLLNNFLDTDKACAPFWGFIAIIASIDIYHSKKTSEGASSPVSH